jgi:hypothetical protein
MTFSLLWGTGFETNQLATVRKDVSWYVDLNSFGVVSGGVGGSYALRVVAHTNTPRISYYKYTLPISKSELYVGFHGNASDSDASENIPEMRLYVGSDWYAVRYTVTGNLLYFYITRNDTVVSSGTIGHALGWHSVQVHYKVDSSDGIFTVRVDSVDELEITGDTQISTGTSITDVSWYCRCKESTQYFDNFYIGEGGWGGALRITKLSLTGDSSTTWTPSSGSVNYSLLNEIPPTDTGYVSSDTNDAKDFYEVENFDVTDKVIAGVILYTRAYRGDSSSNCIIPMLQISGSNFSGSEHLLDTSYIEYLDVWDSNPATEAEWTDDDIDGFLVGFENVVP